MKKRPLLGIFLCMALGIVLFSMAGGLQKAPLPFVNGERMLLYGTILELSFTETSQEILLSHVYLPSDPSYQGQVLVYENQKSNYHIGNQIKVTGNFQELKAARNPGQFDQKSYYEAKGIGFVVTKAETQIKSSKTDFFAQTFFDLRARLKKILKETAGEEKAALFSAMILGDKGLLQTEQKELYQSGGISHILAISGLHISLVGMAFYRLLRKWKRSYLASVLASGSFMVWYGFLVGFGVSAQRAILMFLVFLGAEYFGRSYDLISSLSMAGILILIKEPRMLFQCSFQLSFLSVGAVGGVYPILKQTFRMPGKIGESLLLGLSVTGVTLPCLLYWFFEWMPYSLLLNLLVVPLVPVVFLCGVSGMLLGSFCPFAGEFFAGPGIGILTLFEGLLKFAGGLPASRLILGRPEMIQVGIYVICFLAAVFWPTRRLKPRTMAVRGFLLAAGLLMLIFPMGRKGEVTVLDVGQGDSIFLRTPKGSTCLIDGGSTTESHVGRYRILPFLKSRGVAKLDYLFLTHMDADHINGAVELLESQNHGIRIRNLCLGEIVETEEERKIKRLAEENGTKVVKISKGTRFLEEDFSLVCLSPPKGGSGEEKNENSLVLHGKMEGISFLFTGDLEGRAEKVLIEEELVPEVCVLKVAHHGSGNATSEAFLDLARPKISLISCGEGNRYGHPDPELMKRLKQSGSQIYDTRSSGAITMYLKKGKMQLSENCPAHKEKYLSIRGSNLLKNSLK